MGWLQRWLEVVWRPRQPPDARACDSTRMGVPHLTTLVETTSPSSAAVAGFSITILRVALPCGTIDQDGEALHCKIVGTGRLPAIRAPAALNLVRAAELDELACTPAVLKIAMLPVEIGAARQTGGNRRNENPVRNRMRHHDGAMPRLPRVDGRQRRSRPSGTGQGLSTACLALLKWQSKGH